MSNKLVEEIKKNKKPKKNYVKDPNFVLLHYGNSMDVALDKGSCRRFQTFKGTGEKYSFYSYFQKYKRNYKSHKKGDRKLITRERQQKLYVNLAEAWKAISDTPEYSLYIQASTGLNHKRRDVIVLDFDANKYFPVLENGEMFGYRTFEEAEKDVNDFVENTGLPKQSYIYYNKKSGNIQVGWFFSPEDSVCYDNVYYQEQCRNYLNMGVGLNKLWADYKGMPGDVHFTGWQCKNPYNKNYELRETKFYFNDYSEFNGNFESILTKTMPFFPEERKEKDTIEKELERLNAEQIVDEIDLEKHDKPEKNFDYKLNKDSRNFYEVSGLREWIWQYARTHNNVMPSYAEAYSALMRIEKDIKRFFPCKDPKTEKELNCICKSVYKWSVHKYKKPGTNFYTDYQREFGKLYRIAKMYSNILQLNELGNISSRKAAKKLGLSKTTVCRYRNLSKNDLERIKILSKQFEINNSQVLENFENKPISSIYLNRYINLINKINSFTNPNLIQTPHIIHKNSYYKRDGTVENGIFEKYIGKNLKTIRLRV